MSYRSTITTLRRLRRVVVTLLASVALLALSPGISQAATPAWKLLAITGPTNLPPRQSETQRITVEAEGGTFTLGRHAAEGEGMPVANIGFFELTEGSTIATEIFAAAPFKLGELVTGEGMAPGTTVVGAVGTTIELSTPATETNSFAFLTASTKEVSGVSTSSGEFLAGQELSGEYLAPGTTITSVSGSTLTLSDFVTGVTEEPVALTGRTVSAPLPYDASAVAVGTGVESLGFEPGSIKVTGGPGGTAESPYSVNFGGALADSDVEELSANGGSLVGAHANIQVRTTVPGGNGTGEISINPANIGGATTFGPYTVTVGPLPTGIVSSGQASGQGWSCPGGAGESSVTCTSSAPVPPLNSSNNINVPVEVQSAAVGGSATATISGGGGGSASTVLPIVVSTKEASSGIAAFWAGSYDEDGNTEVQAGGHPYSAQTYFLLNTVRAASGTIVPAGDPRNVTVDLPPGFVGDPLATPRCPQDQLTAPAAGEVPLCNAMMTVGNFTAALATFTGASQAFATRIFNDAPPRGYAAEFTSQIASPLQSLLGSLRSSEDFGVRITAPNNPNYNKIYGAYAALEDVPPGANGGAFLRNPTDCAELAREAPIVRSRFETWQPPHQPSADAIETLPPVTGCDQLQFHPNFAFQPTTTNGSSGTGATALLHLPQEGLTDPTKLASPDLKKATVTLPRGLTLNPSSANGLESCNESQIGYEGAGALPNPTRFDEEPVACPDGSKLGTFTIETPLLEEEVEGTIYLASQEENPFHSLIALYLVVENERFGLVLKLPGQVNPDPGTGQLTATFDYNPQLPFEDLTLHFRGGGARSELATPEVCGSYKTTGSLEPWSAPESGPPAQIEESGFTVSSGCSSSDGARPFGPSFEAGTTGTQAGAYTPLVIKVARKDGEQELRSLNFTLPKGLTGKLAGIPYCPEAAIKEAEGKTGKAEQASSSCPAASRLGSVDTAAGVGSEPIHVGGSVYLAGPYEGAPLSSVVITPAVAGPFDLGDVVVRAPLFVDPESAQITAKSDPIPTILKGIPLKVRSVAIDLDRPGFTLNPTSCEPMTASASILGSSGATASPSNRFQVGGCSKLKFKPRLKISLKGSTKRIGHPALKAVVTYPKKGAYSNIARAQVNLPHSEFLDQGNLNKTCTKPVLLEGKCPKKSIYGKAKAWTPLLEKPLEGPVYLVGGYGYKLPALVAELNGQIRVVLKGKVDSGQNKGIRNTFEAVPDAPVSRFVLEMKGGEKYGLLENSENLCKVTKAKRRAIARFTAQNGLVEQTKPLIANQCGKKSKKGGKPKRHGQGGRGKNR